MFEAMTKINPTGNTYRIHLNKSNNLRMEMFNDTPEIFGSVVDRLGEYEKMRLEPDEAFKLLKRNGLLPRAAYDEEAKIAEIQRKRSGL